jgi:cytidylate kinase
MQNTVIAIDGPAASGKSSVARRVAAQLGWRYVNTGNMYRAVTWAVLQRRLELTDSAGIAQIAIILPLEYRCSEERHITISMCGMRLEDAALNSPEVNQAVSYVARVQEVRDRLVADQRRLANDGPIVMEGRDIGSVVFPETPFKLYIDASEEVRAMRRQSQGMQDAVSMRDKMDSTRKNAPLIVPEGATRIDSSDMNLDQVVAAAVADLEAKGLRFPQD